MRSEQNLSFKFLRTVLLIGTASLIGCAGKDITQTIVRIDNTDIEAIKSMFGCSTTVRAWRYNADNKTIAEVYTPDASGQLIIPVQGKTLSWGWGIRVGDRNCFPIPVALIATHIDQPVLAERKILDEEERGHYFRSYPVERPDPGFAFNWGNLTVTGVSVPTPTIAVQNKFGSLGRAELLPVDANKTVEIPLRSQPDQYGNLGPLIWVSEAKSDGELTRYGFISQPGFINRSVFAELTLNLDYEYAHIPWEIVSNNPNPANGEILISGDQSGPMAATHVLGGHPFGEIAVPTMLPETNYTLRYDYTSGVGACTLVADYGNSLPDKINLNVEPLSITDANFDTVNNRVEWQIEQSSGAQTQLFLAESFVWQWLATAPSSNQSWDLPRLPKEILNSLELKSLGVFSHTVEMTVVPNGSTGFNSNFKTQCKVTMPSPVSVIE